MARYSLSFTTDELIEWLRAKGVDEEDCSKIRVAKFRGVTFIRMEEEHFKEMGLPVGTRLFLEELVKQAKSDPGPQSEKWSLVETLPKDGCKACFEDLRKKAKVERTQPKPVTVSTGLRSLAIFPYDQLWDKTSIAVCFLNAIPSSWTYSGHNYRIPSASAGHVITEGNILALANKWSTRLPPSIPKEKREKVPKFVPVTDPMQSDIRVWFLTSGGCSSQVGTNALDVTKGDKEENATMFLNLSGDDRRKEHLVMHEFGHALGLGHEHQRAVFWDNIKKFCQPDVVKAFLEGPLQSDIATLGNTPGTRSKEYDPDSIMHYWVKSEWLLDEYNSLEKVNNHPDLAPEEREILEGFFKRVGNLAEELSPMDLESIADAYSKQRAPARTSIGSVGTGQDMQAAPTPSGPPSAYSEYTDSASSEPDYVDPETLPTPPKNEEEDDYPHVELLSFILNTLYTAAFKARPAWREIGMGLGMENSDLQSIDIDKQKDVGSCFREMLNRWLQSRENCYLDSFFRALRLPQVNQTALITPVKVAVLTELRDKRALSTADWNKYMSRKRPSSHIPHDPKRTRKS